LRQHKINTSQRINVELNYALNGRNTFGSVKNAFLILLIAFAATGYASDGNPGKSAKCRFEGRVFDAENAEGLAGARVYIKELNREAYADFNGAFVFDELPKGDYTLEISMVSYGEKVIKNMSLSTENEETRTFFLNSL
jgi:hypothetical protein